MRYVEGENTCHVLKEEEQSWGKMQYARRQCYVQLK